MVLGWAVGGWQRFMAFRRHLAKSATPNLAHFGEEISGRYWHT